jgi:hypothetical protein
LASKLGITRHHADNDDTSPTITVSRIRYGRIDIGIVSDAFAGILSAGQHHRPQVMAGVAGSVSSDHEAERL